MSNFIKDFIWKECKILTHRMYLVIQFLRFSDGFIVSEKDITKGTYLNYVKQICIPHGNNVNTHMSCSYFITLLL
jgi:hypothetical protein